MESASTSAAFNRVIPRHLLSAAFLMVVGLAWLYPIIPSGDGPFQTLNWISRIKEGQLPGRDFDVFHGIGVLWTHALLALPFGATREVIWVHYLGSLIAQWLLWSSVFRAAGRSWGNAMSFGAALCGLMSLTSGIPFANLAMMIGAGHSMVGARVALPLLGLFLAQRTTESSQSDNCWKAGLCMGGAAGFGAWFATDQALASLMMAIVVAIAHAWCAGSHPPAVRMIRTLTSVAMVIMVAAATYGSLLWLTTGGAVDQCLTYWWKTLPKVQFWYFGGAPNNYLHGWRDFLDPSILILGFASIGLHVAGLIHRRPGQWPLRLGLAAYGLVSLLPLLGMFFPHYLSGLWCTGLIGILMARWPDRVVGRLFAKVPSSTIRIVLITACLVLSARTIQVQWKNKARCRNPEQLRCSLSGEKSVEKIGGTVPEFVLAEFRDRPSPNLLRAFYRATPEISLGQPGVGRFDYIIHALGNEQQEEYRDILKSSPPLFFRVPTRASFQYVIWLWHQWPELWLDLLSNYRLQDLHDGSAYWRRIERSIEVERKASAVQTVIEEGVTVIRPEERTLPGALLHLKITYHTEPIHGPLASVVDKMTRVTLRPSGVVDDQAFSWAPGPVARTKDVYLVPAANADLEVRLAAEGPLLSSRLLVDSVVAEEIRGFDVEGLNKTLQP